jgi:hypothetical protein
MTKRFKEGILPFKIVLCNEPLVARSGLVLPYKMAKALKLPRVIDEELPGPGSGRGYKPSQFVPSLILMFHGGGKKLEDLREIKGEMSLRELLEMESLPASCTLGDWLRRMGEDTNGLSGLAKVNRHLVKEVILKDQRNGYTLDVDASIIASEKEEAKVTYKGEKGYQPQMGFLSEAGLIIEDEFREGNIPAGAGMVDFIQKCCEAMPVSKTITSLRGDSALYQAGVINFCSERGTLFTITADQDKGVKETVKTIKEWQPYYTYANAVFFRIAVIAYNLFLAMKLLTLPPWYRSFTIQTVRWRLYQIAGAVVRHAHQLLLKIVASINKIVVFCKFRLRCYELAYT